MSSSSSNKRRKVTVDIKQTKLERGSVFARLGNKEKRKKLKPESESGSKSKKDSQKPDYEATEERKKSKSSKFDDAAPTKKSSKEYSKSKLSADDSKDYKKTQRYAEESEMIVVSETGRTHSKHKSERGDRKLQKMENLIIEKRVSPSSSLNTGRSRSVTPSSLSPRKKSKKHSTKHSSHEKSSDHHRYLSESPERPIESHKHKERGRSREKKKSSKESSKKMKEYIEEEEYETIPKTGSGSKHSSSKAKKAAKHAKYEKEAVDDLGPEKKSKPRHAGEISVEKEKTRTKISPVVFEHSSDDNYSKERKHEERGKAKRRKYENASPSSSPVRHKKSKRHSSVDEPIRSAKTSPAKHSSKKKSHKETEVVSKKKQQKEDYLQGAYSDYSSTSKHSQPEFSEISQTSGGNDEPYSSDSYAEKETKKRPKMKKKTKKDVETPPSKSHYEVIDDDFSDEVKKVKKRKRKRDEPLSPEVESPMKEERYREKERRHNDAPKKKAESFIQSPQDRTERSEKYEHSRHDSYERQSPQRERSDSSRHRKIQSQVKTEIRSPESSYFDSRKERDRDTHDRRREQYQEPRQTIQRYSPERRDPGYSKGKIPTRHLSPERSADNKVLDWQRKTSKHISNERKEVIPRLMSVQYTSDRRSDGPRPPAQSKYVPQRKMHNTDYSYQHDPTISRSGHSSLSRGVMGGERNLQDRRPPPLLPSFSRNRSPARVSSHIRDNRSYNDEQDRFTEIERKHDKPHRRDPAPRNDSRDRKYPPIQDEIRDHHVRSSSRDSRSSFRHSSLENKAKGRLQSDIGSTRSMQSPHSDRNSSLERREYKKPIQERLKLNETYERRPDRSLDRMNTKNRMIQDRHERGRPGERSRPLKRHLNESIHSVSPHDGSKKKRLGSKDVSPHRRRPRDIPRSSVKRHSDIEGDRHQRSSRRREVKEKSPEIGEDEIDELIKEEKEKTPPSEVDWNELETESPEVGENQKETSSVLKKFSPGNVLQRTGIIMDLLPQSMINKIAQLEKESKENEAVSQNSPSFVSEMLQNGLHAYSDERLRKRLLGHNTNNRHSFYPPRVINAKTYSASMKEYMRKIRLVEAV